jgi:hypothetical protein
MERHGVAQSEVTERVEIPAMGMTILRHELNPGVGVEIEVLFFDEQKAQDVRRHLFFDNTTEAVNAQATIEAVAHSMYRKGRRVAETEVGIRPLLG